MLFHKSKSKTLKVLNFILSLSVFFCLIALITSLVNLIFPEDYSSPRCTGLICPVYSDFNHTYAPDARPTIVATLVLVCLITAIFVCNKWRRLFDVSKPAGLKALTAISALAIAGLTSSILSGIVYEAFSHESNIKSLIVILLAIAICALSPFIANLLHIFDSRRSKLVDYLNVIVMTVFCGSLISLANTLIFAQSYDCESKYYCDQNSLPRTIVTEILIALLAASAIFAIKAFYNKKDPKNIQKNPQPISMPHQYNMPHQQFMPQNITEQPREENSLASGISNNPQNNIAHDNNSLDYFDRQM